MYLKVSSVIVLVNLPSKDMCFLNFPQDQGERSRFHVNLVVVSSMSSRKIRVGLYQNFHGDTSQIIRKALEGLPS